MKRLRRDVRAIERHKRRGRRWLTLAAWARRRAERHVIAATDAAARLRPSPALPAKSKEME